MVIVGVFDNMAMNIEDCINTLIDMDKIYPVEYEAIYMAITALEYRKPMKVNIMIRLMNTVVLIVQAV